MDFQNMEIYKEKKKTPLNGKLRPKTFFTGRNFPALISGLY